jgi:hypothetical protein
MVPRPSGHTKQVFGPTAGRGPLVNEIYTDGRGARVEGPAEQGRTGPAPIVTLGCSFTWGHGVGGAETYSSRLGRELGVPVSSFAMASYGTTQPLQLLKRNRDLKPRLVVYGFIYAHLDRNVLSCAPSYLPFCLDVAHVGWDEAGKPRVEPPSSDGVRRLQRHIKGDYLNPVTFISHGIDVTMGRVELVRSNHRFPDLARREEAFVFLLADLKRTVAEMGAELLVVHIPTKYEAAPPELVRAIGTTRFIDMTPVFNRHKDSGGPALHIVDDGHPNPLAHSMIADEIARYVRRERLL